MFQDAVDRRVYLALLRRFARRHGTDFWAYCLMSNHVHLIAVPAESGSLARTIGRAQMAFARWLNARHGRSGHLWANRYFSVPMDGAHLWAAVRYIETNPVRAGLVEQAELYPWSSARIHCGQAPSAFLAKSRPFPGDVGDWSAWLTNRPVVALVEEVRRSTRTGRPVGDESFLDVLEVATGRALRTIRGRGRPRKEPPLRATV